MSVCRCLSQKKQIVTFAPRRKRPPTALISVDMGKWTEQTFHTRKGADAAKWTANRGTKVVVSRGEKLRQENVWDFRGCGEYEGSVGRPLERLILCCSQTPIVAGAAESLISHG